jgi:hypothetical protein
MTTRNCPVFICYRQVDSPNVGPLSLVVRRGSTEFNRIHEVPC